MVGVGRVVVLDKLGARSLAVAEPTATMVADGIFVVLDKVRGGKTAEATRGRRMEGKGAVRRWGFRIGEQGLMVGHRRLGRSNAGVDTIRWRSRRASWGDCNTLKNFDLV